MLADLRVLSCIGIAVSYVLHAHTAPGGTVLC